MKCVCKIRGYDDKTKGPFHLLNGLIHGYVRFAARHNQTFRHKAHRPEIAGGWRRHWPLCLEAGFTPNVIWFFLGKGPLVPPFKGPRRPRAAPSGRCRKTKTPLW